MNIGNLSIPFIILRNVLVYIRPYNRAPSPLRGRYGWGLLSNTLLLRRSVPLPQKRIGQAAIHSQDLPGRLAKPIAHQQEHRFGLIGGRDRLLGQCAFRIELGELGAQ
jgi:hypothetical protein